MVLRSSLLRGNVLSCVSLALLVSLVPACSDDSPESDARGGSDGDETSPESDGADEEVDLALASLTVSVGPLQPAFDPTLDAFEVAFSGVPAAKLVAVPRNPEAKVAIAGVEGQERSLRAPLGSTEVEVTVSVGEKSRTVRVELARSGQYVAETPIPPPDEPAMDDSNPNSKGYGYPTVSPDGRFIAVQLSAPTANAYQRWIDIFRADGPELVFEKRLDNTDKPIAFCDADPGCLWTYRGSFDETPARWQFTLWGDGAWSELGPSWEWSGDKQYIPLHTDAPHVVLAYEASGDGGTVPLGADGGFGAMQSVPGLRWSDQMGDHVVSKDRKVLIHTDWDQDGEGDGLRVYEQTDGGWSLTQTIAPSAPTTYWGSSMLLSDDGRELYVGDSWVPVGDLLEAGGVHHYTRGANGYELVETIFEPEPRAFGMFGWLLRGDATTGDLKVGAIEMVGEVQETLVYALRDLGEPRRVHHPGGTLRTPRDASYFAGVALDERQHGVLHVYR